MKHKAITALLILLSLLGLCACSNAGTQIKANKSTFIVNYHVDCNEDVYGIHFEYYLDGTPVGGGVVGNADGAQIAKDDVLVKDFISDDFPESAELTQFQLELFIVDNNGKEYPCDSILNITAEYGKTYDVAITGSCKAGFSVKEIL